MSIELLFLGTGTSAGIPMIACHCPVCTSADPRDKRTRPSVLVSHDNAHVLVDATPELRMQCLANNVDRIDAVVFTHAHADHIMGVDDLRRFNTVLGGPLDVWADPPTHQILQRAFGYAFGQPDPLSVMYRPHLVARSISGPFEIAGRRWIPIPLLHGDQPILGFRIGRLAYCTDVSRIPEESYALLTGLDVLVLDGLQFRKHPTHFSIDEAIAAAGRIAARNTYFTHIAHQIAHEATSRLLPPGVALSYDGLRVSAAT